ncbi:Bax inhibitor-1/YccA family protein [Emcibacter sp. SYSU 3D8]|uniref:Bax inhibitor-1/YccA family protein n=1 Tax=Emcibacter sp. SYSU 3D8 TaxID=3133969 RepID=UPI0031FEFF03
MAQDYRAPASVGTGTAADIDRGLRAHMLHVYNYMASGVLLTGIVALVVSSMAVTDAGQLSAFGQAIYLSPLKWVVILSPLALVMVMSFGLNKLSLFALQASYWVYAGLMGLSLSSIFLMYTGESIAKVFFITAGMFGALSLYGYTTKRDLGPVGKFMFMGLIGIIIASVVNIFMASTMMSFVISVIGVLVFAGLTAYDTQKIKELYYAGYGKEQTAKLSVMGALSLYLDFINLFMMLLRLFGSSRD